MPILKRIPSLEIDRLLASVDPLGLLEALHIPMEKNGGGMNAHCHSGEHTDSSPSFHVHVNNPLKPYHCYSCGWTPNAITLVQKVRDCSFIEAVQFLAELSGYYPDGLGRTDQLNARAKPPPPAPIIPQRPKKLAMDIQARAVGVFLHHLLAVNPSSTQQAMTYLVEERRLSSDAINQCGPCYYLRKDHIPELVHLLKSSPDREKLHQAGILVFRDRKIGKGPEETLVWFDDGVLFASLDRLGNRHLYLRQRRTNVRPGDMRYMGQGGGEGTWVVPYGLPSVQQAVAHRKPLLIVEGAPDALTALSQGVCSFAVLGRPGFRSYAHADTTSQGRTLDYLADMLRQIPLVAVLPDNDANEDTLREGKNKARELVRWLRLRRIPSRMVTMNDLGLGDSKDLNEAWINKKTTQWKGLSDA